MDVKDGLVGLCRSIAHGKPFHLYGGATGVPIKVSLFEAACESFHPEYAKVCAKALIHRRRFSWPRASG
jgi:hypothetical protein